MDALLFGVYAAPYLMGAKPQRLAPFDGQPLSKAGYDMLLTRQKVGAGFGDGDWGTLDRVLREITKSLFGELEPQLDGRSVDVKLSAARGTCFLSSFWGPAKLPDDPVVLGRGLNRCWSQGRIHFNDYPSLQVSGTIPTQAKRSRHLGPSFDIFDGESFDTIDLARGRPSKGSRKTGWVVRRRKLTYAGAYQEVDVEPWQWVRSVEDLKAKFQAQVSKPKRRTPVDEEDT
jgi:hypothetical protein